MENRGQLFAEWREAILGESFPVVQVYILTSGHLRVEVHERAHEVGACLNKANDLKVFSEMPGSYQEFEGEVGMYSQVRYPAMSRLKLILFLGWIAQAAGKDGLRRVL